MATEALPGNDESKQRIFKLKFVVSDEVAAAIIGTQGLVKVEIEVIHYWKHACFETAQSGYVAVLLLTCITSRIKEVLS